MEIHIPYLALRSHTSHTTNNSSNAVTKPHRRWKNLSFLGTHDQSANQPVHVIHEAQISFVVCGTDHRRWTGYCFVDTAFDNNDEDDYDAKYGDDYDAEDGDEVEFDPILSDSCCVADAQQTSWDPRSYFLRVVDCRLKQVRAEWSHLVRKVETSVC